MPGHRLPLVNKRIQHWNIETLIERDMERKEGEKEKKRGEVYTHISHLQGILRPYTKLNRRQPELLIETTVPHLFSFAR
jgi:hypothetical protein